MICHCQIVPSDVLERLSKDTSLPANIRQHLSNTIAIDVEMRRLRQQAARLTTVAGQVMTGAAAQAVSGPPAVSVYDCHHTTKLPGRLIPHPGDSPDATIKNVYNETTAVAQFYKQAFNRDSIDNANMALLSSIHYGVSYNNAFWNGSRMTYGDGDGSLFIDFSKGNDVIGHELTHGVTQHSLQLEYTDDAGGLNESISDCFGSMFRQWQANQTADEADWLIGKDIIGPAAQARGLTCLRDMANPAAAHCLAPQPTKYLDITPGMDPHYSSGPPNLAFYTACKTASGKSWEGVGKVWYQTLTGSGAVPKMTMKDFANHTRAAAAQLFPGNTALQNAVDQGWKHVGL
jgi:Zn-dependent metalloprotease